MPSPSKVLVLTPISGLINVDGGVLLVSVVPLRRFFKNRDKIPNNVLFANVRRDTDGPFAAR